MKSPVKLYRQETTGLFGRIQLALWLGWLSLCCLPLSAENVILFISDGMGFEQVKAARCYNGGLLSFEAFPNQANCSTYSADNAVTDSAAAGTAIATAFKVNNGVISLAVPGDGRELETLLEFSQKRGKRVGLITTTYLTHATPATFGAHTSSRNNTTEIGSDYLNQTRPDVLFGGGGYGLDAASAGAAGYAVATDTMGFNALDPASGRLGALFGSSFMPYEYDYYGGTYPYPHLADMVAKALAALQNGPDGFFLMVEAGMIDPACHDNHLPRAVHETLELSWAVQVALDWLGARTDTMIVVTADHETGGLTVVQDNGLGNYPTVTWSTTGHTATYVPVYALRRNAELVQGTLDNTDFFNLLTAENSFSPVLARVSAEVLGETSAQVTWLTDVPSTSQVEYGTISGNYDFIVTDATLVTAHSVALSGLTAGQKYYYRVTSQDAASSVATSSEYTFTPASLVDPGLLVAAGSVWKYDDTGTDLGTAWQAHGYNDANWKSGPAELGYGDGDEATVISYGADANNKYVCSYFRHAFSIDHAVAYTDLRLSVLRDDGAVVYLNGTEVARYNMPSGTIAYSTLASSSSDFDWDAALAIPNLLVDGDNVLAVEVHQASGTSSDASMDLQLTATRLDYDVTPPAISGLTVTEITESSAVVTWTTDEPADSRLQYGVSEEYGLETVNTTLVTTHRMALTGLGANTTYYFVVRSADANGNAAFGPESSFATAPGNPPSAPLDLTATAQSSSAILLAWSDTSSNEAGFEIHQSPDGQTFSFLVAVGADVTSALVTGLLPATSYSYFVRAFNGAGYADSDVAGTTTRPPNTPPVATDQDVSTAEDVSLSIAFTASDPDAGPSTLSYTIGTPPSNGTLGPTIDNQVAYTPNPDYYGTDSFTFLAYDGADYSLPATVSITVSAVNDPPVANPDTAGTLQGVAITIAVLANDTDTEGQALTVAAVTQGAGGTVFTNADNTVRYRSTGHFTGQDTFTYTVSDGASTAVTVVTVTVDPNVLFSDGFESGDYTAGGWGVSGTASVDASAASAGSYGALLKKTAVITKSLYSAGPGMVTLSYSRSSGGLEAGELGWVEVSYDGQTWAALETVSGTTAWETQAFEFTLDAPDLHIRFRVDGNDGNDAFMVDEVAVTGAPPNTAPTATSDAYTVVEDASLSIAASGVLANDTDPEGDALAAVLVNGPANGGLVLSADGAFAYTPNANFNGLDNFSYKASDGAKESAFATVAITVTAVNDPPVCAADGYTTIRDTTLTVPAPGVLANDTDADGDTLSASVQTGPASGSLTLNADGSFTYTPHSGFTGGDSFVYQAGDGQGGIATATVALTVNWPEQPTAVKVISFHATRTGPHQVTVRWKTGVEFDVLGFRVERQGSNACWTAVGGGLIASNGANRPNDYVFYDNEASGLNSISYRLIEIDIRGTRRVAAQTLASAGLTVAIRRVGPGVELGVQGLTGDSYYLVATTDLIHGPWQRLGGARSGTNGAEALQLEVRGTDPLRFFRLVRSE